MRSQNPSSSAADGNASRRRRASVCTLTLYTESRRRLKSSDAAGSRRSKADFASVGILRDST